MPIQFECPHCGRKLRAPDAAAGKSSNCPGCGNRVTAPEPIYEAEVIPEPPPPPPPAPRAKPAPSPYDDLDDGDPYALEGPEEPPDLPEQRRPCPVCGEMIVASAAKCRFCGEIFDPTLKKTAKKKKKRKRSTDPDDADLSTGEILFGVFCSGIACIVGLIWMIQGKPKGAKLFGIAFVFVVIWNVVRFMIETNIKQP